MSMYNMVFGMNQRLLMILSGIVGYRIDKRFPRFRDVFLADDEAQVTGDFYVYTRMGGGNRECSAESDPAEGSECSCTAHIAERLEADPQCAGRYDDVSDSTYSTFAMRFTLEQMTEWRSIQEGNVPGDFLERMQRLFDSTPATQKEDA